MKLVTIDLSTHPPDTPLGVLLAPACPSFTTTPQESTLTILAGWERLAPSSDETGSTTTPGGGGTKKSFGGGRLGPIQRTGQVRLGDRLVRINNVDITRKTFREVMDLLKSMVHPDKAAKKSSRGAPSAPRLQSLSFEAVPAAGPVSLQNEQLSMQQNGGAGGFGGGGGGGESSSLFDMSPTRGGGHAPLHHGAGKLYSFASTVRRARIHSPTEELEDVPGDDPNDDAPHVEYEIICNLCIRSYGKFTAGLSSGAGGAGSGEEIVWSVWRRYSQFKELDAKLRQSYGWQIDALNDGWGLRFPGGHAIYAWFVGNQDAKFVESRRAELESYWQALQRIDDAFDLNPNSQKYSRHVAAFLDVERHLPRIKSHLNLNLHSDASVASGAASLVGGGLGVGGGGGGLHGDDLGSPLAADADDDLPPRSNNELLNIVLETRGSSALDTSILSTGTYSTPGKKKKRIAGAAKAAFQRMDDL